MKKKNKKWCQKFLFDDQNAFSVRASIIHEEEVTMILHSKLQNQMSVIIHDKYKKLPSSFFKFVYSPSAHHWSVFSFFVSSFKIIHCWHRYVENVRLCNRQESYFLITGPLMGRLFPSRSVTMIKLKHALATVIY